MTFRNKRNISALRTQVSHRKRAAAAGLGVLMTSALALPGSMVALSADSANAAKGGPRVAEHAYWGKAGFSSVSGPLGATGALPRNSNPSSELLGNARNLAKFAASAGRGGLRSHSRRNILAELAGDPGAMVKLPPGPLGIPGVMLRAYRRAQQIMATQQPGCHLPWWLLAGIGQVESSQADGGLVDAQGNTLVPILGPTLDGTNGTAAVPAYGGGWQRAMGPMQFLPSTWSIWGGGNPNNVYDAALAAGRYLCSSGWNLSNPAQQAMAVFSYNHSDSYVQEVLTWAYAYAGGVNPLPLRTLLPSGYSPAVHRSSASPSHRSASAGRSSSSGTSTTSSPSHQRSSSPASPSSSPSSSLRTTPKATPKPSPLPLPSLPLPSPLPSLLPSLPSLP